MSEQPEKDEVAIEFMPNGPALVRGTFQLKAQGQWTKKNGSVAL